MFLCFLFVKYKYILWQYKYKYGISPLNLRDIYSIVYPTVLSQAPLHYQRKHIFSVTHIHSLTSLTWTFSEENYGLCLDYDYHYLLPSLSTIADVVHLNSIYHVATDFVLRR